MENTKYRLLLSALLMGCLLSACGTSQPVESPETPQVSQSVLVPSDASVSLAEAHAVIPETASAPPEQSTALEREEASSQPSALPAAETEDQKQQLLKTYYDDSTAENTEYTGCLFSLYRRDRAWVEENESISTGNWPLWDYGVSFYPYARDEKNLYMLSLPMAPDTDTTDADCIQGYQEALLHTLDTLKNYAAGKGLELNPDLDADYSSFVTRLMETTASTADPIAEKLATVCGDAISQNTRDAFYAYLKANPSLWAQTKEYPWKLFSAQDGTTGLEFDGADSSGGFYGTSIHYDPETECVMTFNEYDRWQQSQTTEPEPTEDHASSENPREANP